MDSNYNGRSFHCRKLDHSPLDKHGGGMVLRCQREEYTRIQRSEEAKPDHVAENLLEAVNFIQERINKI